MPGDVELRLGELALHIAHTSQDDPNFGKTKLVKLLAFTDFVSYERRQRPITGATYIKLEYGPAPRELPSTLKRLVDEGRARMVDEAAWSYTQIRVIPQDEPDLSVFRPGDIAITNEVIEYFKDWSNSSMSEASHVQFVGWRLAEEKEEIPYSSVYLSPKAPTENDIRWARDLAGRLGRG